MRPKDLEQTFTDQPTWQPPDGFTARVVLRMRSEPLPEGIAIPCVAASVPRAVLAAALAGGAAYVAGQLVWRAIPEVAANPMPAAWTCALLSLALATSLTRRALRP